MNNKEKMFEKLFSFNEKYKIFARKLDASYGEDILQDSYLKMWEGLDSLNYINDERLMAWGYKVIMNTFSNIYRKNKTSPFVKSYYWKDGPEYSRIEEQVISNYKDLNNERQLLEYCYELVDDFAQPCTHKVMKCFINNIFLTGTPKYEDISHICDVSLGTVKSRINRARHDIQKRINLDDVYYKIANEEEKEVTTLEVKV